MGFQIKLLQGNHNYLPTGFEAVDYLILHNIIHTNKEPKQVNFPIYSSPYHDRRLNSQYSIDSMAKVDIFGILLE